MSQKTLEYMVILEQVLTSKSRLIFNINSGNTWYTSTVKSVKDNEIVIAFPEMFAAVEMILGDVLNCKFNYDKSEYSFDAEIHSIKIDFPQQVTLKIISEIKVCENSRSTKRTYAILPANILSPDTNESLYACVSDVSSTGMRLMCKHYLKESDELDIHIVLPFRNIFDSVLKLKGTIMWSKFLNSRNEYGISITHVDDVYKKRLEQFLKTYET